MSSQLDSAVCAVRCMRKYCNIFYCNLAEANCQNVPIHRKQETKCWVLDNVELGFDLMHTTTDQNI